MWLLTFSPLYNTRISPAISLESFSSETTEEYLKCSLRQFSSSCATDVAVNTRKTVSARNCFTVWIKLEIYRQVAMKVPQNKISLKSVLCQLSCSMHTEGQTGIMKRIVALCDCAKVPNIDSTSVNRQRYALRPHCFDGHLAVHSEGECQKN